MWVAVVIWEVRRLRCGGGGSVLRSTEGGWLMCERGRCGCLGLGLGLGYTLCSQLADYSTGPKADRNAQREATS